MPLPTLREQLTRLIATPSMSSTSPAFDTGNRAVIDLLADWLTALDFRCDIQPVPGHPDKANLVATRGQGPGGLVLAGHTDTVPCDAHRWTQDPFTLTERDDRWYGLGATDMKGFFPVALEAIRALDYTPLQQPLIVLATADEESSMSGARALVEADRLRARYAVVGEPTGMRPVRLHKGIMMESVRLTGREGHSSNPALGLNTIDALGDCLRALQQFRESLQARHQHPAFSVPRPTLNFGCVHGGQNPNKICGACSLDFDLRPLPGMTLDGLREDIRRALAPVARAHGVGVELVTLFPGVDAFEQAADSELVRTVEQLTGHPAEAVGFATEAPFLKTLGIDTVVMGPGQIDQAHQPDEYLALEQIPRAVDTLSALIRRFCL